MKRILLTFLLLTSLIISNTQEAKADVAGLVPCKDSKEFSRRLDVSVKKLEQRLKKYEAGTPPYLAIEKNIEATKVRFDKYGKAGLLCGKDGLPHLITDGRLSHAAEFIIPGVMFLYITGWIGWVGRAYLISVRSTSNAAEKEIILDIPLALGFMSSGFLWPFAAWKEFTSGQLLADEKEVTVSPR